MAKSKKEPVFFNPYGTEEEAEKHYDQFPGEWTQIDRITEKGSHITLVRKQYDKGKVHKLILTEVVYIDSTKKKRPKGSITNHLELCPLSEIDAFKELRIILEEDEKGGTLCMSYITPRKMKVTKNKYTLLELLINGSAFIKTVDILGEVEYKDQESLQRTIRSINADFQRIFKLKGKDTNLIISKRGNGYGINPKFRFTIESK